MLYQLSYVGNLCFSLIPSGAGDGSRTRDVQLGRLELYQLSYSRECFVSLVLCRSLVSNTAIRRLFGWTGKDSNLRSQRRQIYSLFPLATREPVRKNANGAGDGTRTRNLLITNQLLYH